MSTYDSARVLALEARLKELESWGEPEILPHPDIDEAVIMHYEHVEVVVRPAEDGDCPTSGWVVVESEGWKCGVMPDLAEQYGQLLIRAARYAKEREQADEIAEAEDSEPAMPLIDCWDQMALPGVPA